MHFKLEFLLCNLFEEAFIATVYASLMFKRSCLKISVLPTSSCVLIIVLIDHIFSRCTEAALGNNISLVH